MTDPERPTDPPPRRRLPSAPRLPAVEIGRPTPTPVPDSPPSLDSNSRELVLQRIKESEERAEKRAKDAVRDTIEELTAIYERQLAERDREIDALRRGDNTLNEAVAQLREENVRMRTESQAMIASAVTLEVSKRFVTGDEADTKIQGAGRMTQVKSLAVAVIAALVSSGALVQVAQSCQEKPAATAPRTGPGYGGRE